MPPLNFDRFNQADVSAWQKVNPNFAWGGCFYSKDRYGMVIMNGQRFPFHRETRTVVRQPDPADTTTYDPVDWDEIQIDYEYWRGRYKKQGKDYFRPAESVLFGQMYGE